MVTGVFFYGIDCQPFFFFFLDIDRQFNLVRKIEGFVMLIFRKQK